MVQMFSQCVLFGADIDKYSHISFCQTFDYLYILLYAFHHSLERMNHGSDLIVLIAV